MNLNASDELTGFAFRIALDAVRHLVTRHELELMRVQKFAQRLQTVMSIVSWRWGVEHRAASQPTETG